MRLNDAYANGPVCTPTRAALISGRYSQRARLEGVLTQSPADRDRGLPAPGTSLPALLRANGYATGLLGEWHLGWKPEFGPLVERRLFWRWARPNRQQRAVRFGPWKLLDDASQLLLFDLGVDPGERSDLAASRPDLVATLKQHLADWESDVDQGAGSR